MGLAAALYHSLAPSRDHALALVCSLVGPAGASLLCSLLRASRRVRRVGPPVPWYPLLASTVRAGPCPLKKILGPQANFKLGPRMQTKKLQESFGKKISSKKA